MLQEKLLDGTVVDKIQIAVERLQAFEPPQGYYVAFSGGKDSIVVKDLIMRSGVKYDIHQNITTIDPPELLQYVRKYHPDVELHRPEISMWQLIEKKMTPPTKIVRYCCEHLKERGGAARVVVTGVRWAESVKRSRRKIMETCFRNKRKTFVNPVIDWSDTDIWEYIKERNLSYCCLYDEGFSRVGCVGCPMAGKKRWQQFQRWPGFEKSYRRAFEKAYRNILKQGNEYIDKRKLTWTSGDDMFNWWMADNHDSTHPDQGVLFE